MSHIKQEPKKPQKLDLKELQRKQLDGEQPTTQKGNTSAGADYELPTHEADRVHVKLTKKVNDPIKKEYVTESKTVKLVPEQFDRMEKNGTFDEYDSVEVLHDPRGKSAKPTEAERTGAGPMDPVPGLPTIQDAQMRYKQLTGKNAPAVGYEKLIDTIKVLETSTGEHEDEDDLGDQGEAGTGTTTRKAIRSTADAQARYKELFGEDAPADKGFADLKALIEAEETRLAANKTE